MKQTIAIILALVCCLSGMSTERTDSISRPKRAASIVSGAAIGLAVNAALTEGGKHAIHEMRPDRSSNNSFPSRHTSWAYTGTTLLSAYLYKYSPWYSLGAHAIAGAIGAQRIIERRHYASDVVAGAAIGIVSAELGIFLGRKIFGGSRPEGVPNDFRTSVDVATGAIYAFNSPEGIEICTGYSTGISLRQPLSEHWGISATAEGTYTPVRAGGEVRPLNAIGLRLGACSHFGLPEASLAIEPVVEAGAMRLTGARNYRHDGWGFSALAGCALNWRLTSKFSFRASAHLRVCTTSYVLAGAGVSVGSVAVF